jgi:hypothetical protein
VVISSGFGIYNVSSISSNSGIEEVFDVMWKNITNIASSMGIPKLSLNEGYKNTSHCEYIAGKSVFVTS